MEETTTNTREQNGTAPKRRPVHEIRIASVRAAIWMNQTSKGPVYNVTFTRLYLDRDDHWQSSDSFGRDELPILARVIDLAHDWIYYSQQGQEEA
jgi:hypothetical protein